MRRRTEANHRIRVAVVAPQIMHVGGLQAYAWQVARWLRDSPDHDVVVIGSHPGRGVRREERDGIPVLLLGAWLTLSNTPINPFWYFALRRLLRRLRIDVVNAHAPVPYLPDLAVFAAGRRPSVLTYHAGSMVKGDGRTLVDRLLRAYERLVLPRVMTRASQLVAASPTALVAGSARASVITPGVDIERFRPPASPSSRPRSVVYVGVLKQTSRWKGVEVLVEALAAVPGVRLELVGDGDLRTELEETIAAYGMADRVVWHGEQPPDRVAEIVAGSGVLVLPSLTDAESFGMVLVEAMATATPVIGSAVGGIPRVIRDGVDGLLVAPGDVTSLRVAIQRILEDPALAARLGAAGRTAAEQRWSWEHQRAETLRVLQEPRRPVRLAVLTDAVAPWHTGGKEQRQKELWMRLAARGLEVEVHTMRWWTTADDPVVDGVRYRPLMRRVPLYTGRGRRSIGQALGFALASIRMLGRDFDVLEVDAIPFLQIFPARVVCWLRRKPMVVTWHEYWGRRYWVDYLGPLGHLAAGVEQAAASLPDHILAVSEGTAERLRAVGTGERRLSLVTPGIALQTLPTATPAAAHGEHRRPTALHLLYAGRLLDHKRVDVAIDTVAELARRGRAARLTVIGAGPAAAQLREHARGVGAAAAVEFLDFLPEHRDVLAVMAQADVFLFPSQREGFGMVALEALAMGTPVVTSDHPDNFAQHLIDDGINGVVAPNDPIAYADAVEQIASRPEEYAAGALRVAQRYDWEQVADRAAEAYLATVRPA